MEDRKFTLLELLIVIAMIGILVSLLLPSLTKAREAGKKAVYLSNNHPIYLSLATYNGVYQQLSPGNATARPGIGIHSTFFTSYNDHYGTAYLKVLNFIKNTNVFAHLGRIHLCNKESLEMMVNLAVGLKKEVLLSHGKLAIVTIIEILSAQL